MKTIIDIDGKHYAVEVAERDLTQAVRWKGRQSAVTVQTDVRVSDPEEDEGQLTERHMKAIRFSQGDVIKVLRWEEFNGGIVVFYTSQMQSGSEYHRVAFFRKGSTVPDWSMIAPEGEAPIDRSLSLEQATALREYAKKNGRTWKAKLLRDWDDPRVPEGPVLRQVRNIIGPSGLQNLDIGVAQ